MPHEFPRAEMKSQAPRAKVEKSQAELRGDLERRLYAIKPILDNTFSHNTHKHLRTTRLKTRVMS